MMDALDVMAPKKKFRIPKIWEGKKWFSDEIREAADRRDKAYRKARYEDTEQNWSHKIGHIKLKEMQW